jgi:porin
MRKASSRAARLLSLPLAAVVSTEAQTVESDANIEVEAAYTADFMSNLRGGLRRDSAYLHRIDLTAAWSRAGAREGDEISLFLDVMQTNDETFSGTIVGDSQIVSNIDAAGGVRVIEAFAEYGFRSSASFKLGLYDLNTEFDVIESAALFVNSSQGMGPDIAQSGTNGPSIFPITGLALRADWPAGRVARMRLAVLDGVPGAPDDPDRTSLELSSDEGALVVGETEWAFSTVRAYAGAWTYTSEFPVLGAAAERDRAWGAYAAVDAQLSDALSVYTRFGHAAASVHQFDGYFGAGVAWHDPAIAPRLTLGVATGWARTSRSFRNASSAAGEAPAGREFKLELTARIELAEWLALQPDVQWIRHPGARTDIDDAWVVGLRFEFVRAWR